MGFGTEIEFGPGSLEELGQLYERQVEDAKTMFDAVAVIPEDALAHSAICLSSVWKVLAKRGRPAQGL